MMCCEDVNLKDERNLLSLNFSIPANSITSFNTQKLTKKEKILMNLQISDQFITILNVISLDGIDEIAIKIISILEKLVQKISSPIHLCTVLINLLQNKNFEVISLLLKSISNIFQTMLTSSKITKEVLLTINFGNLLLIPFLFSLILGRNQHSKFYKSISRIREFFSYEI